MDKGQEAGENGHRQVGQWGLLAGVQGRSRRKEAVTRGGSRGDHCDPDTVLRLFWTSPFIVPGSPGIQLVLRVWARGLSDGVNEWGE